MNILIDYLLVPLVIACFRSLKLPCDFWKHLPWSHAMLRVREGFLILIINEETRDKKEWFVQGQPGDYKADFLNHRLHFPSHSAAPNPKTGLKKLVLRKECSPSLFKKKTKQKPKKHPYPLNKCVSRKRDWQSQIIFLTVFFMYPGRKITFLWVYNLRNFYFSFRFSVTLADLMELRDCLWESKCLLTTSLFQSVLIRTFWFFIQKIIYFFISVLCSFYKT